jgi:Ca-activated chloride channel family protein
MRWVRFSKYAAGDLGIDAQDLMQALSDFFLNSGFSSQYNPYADWNPNTLEALKQAIREVLESGELFPEDAREEMQARLAAMSPEEMDELLNNLVRMLMEEGHISFEDDPVEAGAQGGGEGPPQQTRFDITDKSLDFLGYRALKDLLGSLGKSSFGRHDTRDLATGIDASGSSRPWEFGDTMNLDVNATVFSALQREGLKVPLALEYSDLHVHQSEYQSSCATVLMLDCSHSMILYGEDRFTPAKRVAMALAQLIRTQYPGDSLRCVLFHDSAEEVDISQLARVQVGPYYTNTRDGLILAQRLLDRERKDMKQIIMITDGKPSALTLEDGRIYRNAFGLDPHVISQTLEEVNRCARRGVLINTFMLARNYDLVEFVRKVTQICHGKAYFTTPQTLGKYLLMDYLNGKTRTVH